MTKLLLRLFVPNSKNADDPKVRTGVGRLSGGVGILMNLLLFAGKLIIGIFSGSVSVTADAMNNLTDAASSVVTLVGFRLAEKPADPEHPYGHARFEYLSGLAVAALIVVIGFELGKTSVQKIFAPEAVVLSLPMVAVLLLSVGLLAYTVVQYSRFYDIAHLMLLGRVMSGKGGDLILATCQQVMADEFPELHAKIQVMLPDEKTRRVGQSAAAASLPAIG